MGLTKVFLGKGRFYRIGVVTGAVFKVIGHGEVRTSFSITLLSVQWGKEVQQEGAALLR
jgi:hypothetical protein